MIWEDNTKDGFPRNDAAPVNYAWLASHHDAFASIVAVVRRCGSFPERPAGQVRFG
jgi:hypothetical protein